MGYLFSDVATSTSIGTGITNTLLNGGTLFSTSSLAGTLAAVAPVYAETGAYTAGQSIFPLFSTQSTSIGSIQPKNIAIAPSSGGVGTSINAMVPIVRSFEYNTRLPNSTTPIGFYAAAYVANTIAPRVGATLWFDTDQPMRGSQEHFYDANSATTATSTAAATVALGSLTENGGTQLEQIYAHIAPGTVTVSESYIGYLTVNSSDLSPQQTLRAYLQPVGVGLGATTTPLQPDALYNPERITMRNTANLTASYTQEESLTGGGNTAWGVKFIKGAYA